MRDAVEEADHAGPARRDAKLSVRRVHARGGGHGDTQVVGASVVSEGAGPQQAVGADGAKVLLAHVAPVDLHRLKVLLCRVGGRKVVLRHERARVRAGADSRRARRLVDVDSESAERLRPDVDARRAEHARGVRVSRRARVPKLLRRVGEEVRLRTLEQHLASARERLPQQEGDVGAGREVGVVHDVAVEKVEYVLRLVARRDEAEHVWLDLRVRLCLLVQLRLGDAFRRERAPVLAQVALKPRARALLPLAAVEQVVEPQAAPRRLRCVHWAHALQRGAVGRIPRANQVEQLVVRADEVDVPDEESILVAYAGAHQLRHLPLHEGDRVHHALGTDHVDLAGRK
mmetsp:Transcript_1798/g.5933  ORF Transcript_1798/g.5933 Transcript_1798/m.5933 type:complete len:344 (-) Transcript_1798:639-1670(-)